MKEAKKLLFSFCLMFTIVICYGQQKNLNMLFKPTFMTFDTSSVLRSKPIGIKKYDVLEQPFFCKMEEFFTRSSKMNLRIRLGSLDYVDQLEKK
jgi:hypothetical protein